MRISVRRSPFLQNEMSKRERPSLIVTAGGEGIRLEPLTSVIPKCFLPVAMHDGNAESALSRLVRQFRAAGVEHVWLAASQHTWFESLSRQRADLSVVVTEPRGEWFAVTACIETGAISGPTIVVSGDNVLSDRDVEDFVAHAERRPPVTCLVGGAFEESTARYTRLEVTGERVRALVEKPPDARSGLAKAGVYYFSSSALATAVASPRRTDRFGEISMTEVLLGLLDLGVDITYHPLSEGFCDIGDVDGLARAIHRATKWHDSDDGPRA